MTVRTPLTDYLTACSVIVVAAFAVWFLVSPPVHSMLSDKLGWGRYGLGSAVPLRDIEEVSRETQLWLPESAVLVDGELLGGLNKYVIAQIKILHSEVDAFLAQNRFDYQSTEERAITNAELPRTLKGKWNPDSVHHYISAEATIFDPYGCSYRVLIDLDDSSIAVLYLYWFNL